MKKLLSLVLSLVLLFTLTIPASAASFGSANDEILKLPYCPVGETIKIPVGSAEYIDDGTGNLIKISDLLSFSSQDEADTYIANMKQQLSAPTQYNPSINFNSRATHGDALVASQLISFASYINLRVAYTTSGNSNTGTITYHEAYTTFTGFTLGFGWDERMCSSQITSSGKDIYAVTTGELTYNLLVDGFIEIGREAIHLEGYCFAVH